MKLEQSAIYISLQSKIILKSSWKQALIAHSKALI